MKAFSPEFKVLTIQDGFFGNFFGTAMVLPGDRNSIVEDASSFYSGLVRYYDFDLAEVLKDAPFIDGTVIPIIDDVRELSFCHWLIDWLPRLGFLGPAAYRPSTFVVTTPLVAQFQRDSLRMCGFDESRVIVLDDLRAVQARELLVPSNLRDIGHPINKGAPWALSYIRSSVGMTSVVEVSNDVCRREKLYVSRADATRRKIINDAELADALAGFGYRCVQLSGLPLAEQVARFAHASHVISLHGAGLSNLVFATPGTKVIEIFPERYGMVSFAVVAASVGCPYATYIADKTEDGATRQSDNVEVDVPRFLETCGHLI